MDLSESKNLLFVSFELDLTGNRLLDEIMNIGAYSQDMSFKQYVIPNRSVTLHSKRKHYLTTANLFEFRVLRDTLTGKIVKTKTVIFALEDFLSFLERKSKTENKEGVILICFEAYNLLPFILVQALQRYALFERFTHTVKGFINCFHFIKEKCAGSISMLSIRNLAKVLLNSDGKNIHDAQERAKLVYEIIMHLSEGESKLKTEDLALGMTPFIKTVDMITMDLKNMKEYLCKQNDLKPVFGEFIRLSQFRKKALYQRKLLTSADVTYASLKNVIDAKQEMYTFLKSKLQPDTEDIEISELANIIMLHFQRLNLRRSRSKSQNTQQVKNPNPGEV